MITALADEIDVVQGFEAGADDYLVKPFRPRELRARADSMLRRPRERVEQPVALAPAPQAVPARDASSWAAQVARDLQEQSMAPLQASQAAPRHAAPPPLVEPSPVSPAPVEAAPVEAVAADGSWVSFNGLGLNNETRSVTVGAADGHA